MEQRFTKEELEEYYKNSRQYFDNLAKYYLEMDKDYYNEFIAPIYNNPPVTPDEGVYTRHLTLIVGIATALIVLGSLLVMILSLKR
jgi:hypothetical protein